MIKNCKKFFDLVAQAFSGEAESVTKLLEEKEFLLNNFFSPGEDLDNLKKGIVDKVKQIKNC